MYELDPQTTPYRAPISIRLTLHGTLYLYQVPQPLWTATLASGSTVEVQGSVDTIQAGLYHGDTGL